MNRGFLFIFVGVFGFIGVSFVIIASFTLRSEINFRRGAVSAPGVVVDLEPTTGSKGGTLYKPVFTFVDNNDRPHRVVGGVASSPPSFHRGEGVTVLFRPENPEEAHIDSFMEAWLMPLIFGSIGTIFTGIAAGFGIYALRRRTRRAWLKTNGTRVQARMVGVDRDTSMSSGGRHPWRITAQWQDPMNQKVYLFISDAIWFDPTPYLQGDAVEVLVNVDNPRQYAMNTDFLPKAG